MTWADQFIGKTIKGFLVVFGLATCLPILLATSLTVGNQVLFGGLLEATEVTGLALRHWGVMVGCIGILMVAAAFRPWLRFEAMLLALLEKAFMAYLYLGGLGQPWIKAYQGAFLLDSLITLYCLIYFASRHGRPHRWVRQDGRSVE